MNDYANNNWQKKKTSTECSDIGENFISGKWEIYLSWCVVSTVGLLFRYDRVVQKYVHMSVHALIKEPYEDPSTVIYLIGRILCLIGKQFT